MASAESDQVDDLGRLANNYIQVKMLQTALSRADTNVSTIPGLIRRVISEEAWREWMVPETGRRCSWNPAEFRRFIESPRPDGCETSISLIERILRDTPAWIPFHEAIRGERGGANNPFGRAGSPEDEIKVDNVNLDSGVPHIIPIKAPPTPKGNSTNYAVRRLGRERPDLLDQVKSGALSPNAAMVQAGFRPKAITIPAVPKAAVRILVRHFKGDDLDTLVRELANFAGIPLAEPESQP